MTPANIGRYRIERVLGVGGFATVYLAHDPDLEAWVAVKVMADNLARDPSFRDRFVTEARMMRQLQTPGLVTVYDIGDHQGAPFFVMEYCSGGTLDDRLAAHGRPLTLAEGVDLARAVATSTGPIHRAGLVHRDLKPSNYLIRTLTHRPTVVGHRGASILGAHEELAVADFGLVKVVDQAASRASIAGGTPGYSAPEQFRGDPGVDASADVYAVSAMITAALTGRDPTPVLVPGALAFDPDVLAATGPLATELTRGLAVDPSHRHPDVNHWFRAIEAAVAAGTAPATGAGTGGAPGTVAAPVGPGSWDPPSGPSIGTDDGPGTVVASGPHPMAPPAGRPIGDPGPAWSAPTPDRGDGAVAPTPNSSSTVAPEPDRRGRGPMAVLAAAALVVVGGGAAAAAGLALTGGDDGLITGPRTVPVGQEAAFTTTDGASADWTVNDRVAGDGVTIGVTPSGAGPIDIQLTQGDATRTLRVDAVDHESPIRIEGPAILTVGRPAILTASPPASTRALPPTWVVDGVSFVGPTIEVTATGPGTVTVELRNASTEPVTRTLIAVEAP